MKNKKNIIILFIILVLLIFIIIFLKNNIDKKAVFVKPNFDKTVTLDIPSDIEYSSSVINILEGYSIYIEAAPIIENNQLKVDFISLENNNVWIKIRVLDENKNIIGESGLVKPGEYLEHIKMTKKINSNNTITYEIMGYEKDTYISAGTIKLNTKVGA